MIPSSSIGQFVIGESQIGTAPPDWTQTIASQYANSPIILQIITDFSAWLNPLGLIDEFFDQIWNIETATGYGLDLWGRILGVNRVLPAAPNKYFGFEEAGNLSADPFNQSIFYAGEPATVNYPLADSVYRTLLLAKAAANICNGSIPGINAVLRLMFPGLVCYCTDGLDMTMTYTFDFTLSTIQQAMITNSGVLPRPAGVSATLVQI